jgi:hypothetical protein
MNEFYIFIGEYFTPQIFDQTTRIVEILWSAAELLLVFSVLRLADHLRIEMGRRRNLVRWIMFWILVILNPLFLIFMPGITHDRLMLANFSLLIYTVVAEGPLWVKTFRKYFELS